MPTWFVTSDTNERGTIQCTRAAKSGVLTMDNFSSPPGDWYRSSDLVPAAIVLLAVHDPTKTEVASILQCLPFRIARAIRKPAFADATNPVFA